MQATLIGYFPLATVRAPLPANSWAANVVEIASTGGCISAAPEDWIGAWRHNDAFLFDTEAKAWSVVPAGEQARFEIYAYRIFPVLFDKGSEAALTPPAVAVDPLPETFEQLGHDAVSLDQAGHGQFMFSHAPLSCNSQSAEIAVNAYCLLDDRDTAFQVARGFSVREPESGPYVVVEVYRQRRA